MDASGLFWFNKIYSTLHLAVDDAIGTVVGAYFDYQETLNGYYHVLKNILEKHGIPNEFLTDNRTVFTDRSTANPTDGHDTYTQFAYACKSLGIPIYSGIFGADMKLDIICDGPVTIHLEY